jgi:RNA polymerase sigma factor (TIGR02999 family)
MTDVTQILGQIASGNSEAAENLLPLVYEELRRLAALELSREPSGQTLQPTALVHEAYLRLVGQGDSQPPGNSRWNHRGHFYAAAAEAMRRVLIENARRKHRIKHGGHATRLDLDPNELSAPERRGDLLALDEALTRLEQVDPRKAELVKLRYFTGLTTPQAAEVLSISLATAEREWAYAKVWLLRELSDDAGAAPSR